jgi:RHS repeat-associated protein
LGTVRLVTDQNADVIARHDYLPFGEEIGAGIAARNGLWGPQRDTIDQKFTGQIRDGETGLDFFGARYYGGALGRFTSPDDPLNDQSAQDPQSWNLYSYVRNNPLANIDPSGEDCITTSQTSTTLTVTTDRGGSAETCSGTYVNGTVDVNSYSYNPSSNGSSLSWSDNSINGGGAINFVSSSTATDNTDWGPGSSNMLGASQIGRTAIVGNGLGIGLGVIGAGVGAGIAYGAYAGGTGLIGLGIGSAPVLKKFPDLANLSEKIVRQMEARGWTKEDILEAFEKGQQSPAFNRLQGGTAATRYLNPTTGKAVTIDNATGQVIQVGGANFTYTHY